MQEGLDIPAFTELVTGRVAGMIRVGGEAYVGLRKDGRTVVCLATVMFQDTPDLARQAQPHVHWFPEATARDKVEIGLRFLVDLKRQALLLIAANKADWRFFDHLCKYGAVRRVGTIRGYFEDGGDAGLWQGVT